MINEFGEKIGKEEIRKIVNRITSLSSKEIDLLWFKCGWIDSKKGKNKALPQKKIELMLKNKKVMMEAVKNLLLETPKKEVEKKSEELRKN